jgi:hypothetical protein
MERKNRKVLSLLAGLLILFTGGGLIWAAVADNTRVVIVIKCPKGTHVHTCRLNSGSHFVMTTEGGIAAEVGEPFTTEDGLKGTQLKVVDLDSRGEVEGIGEAVFTLDTSRSAESSIVANQPDADFPATQTMRFYPSLTLNGKSFSASEPAEVMNSEVSSFPPPPGTGYVLTHEMTMTSEEGDVLVIEPGKVFTMGEG